MDLFLSLESNSSLAWCGISDITIGNLKSGEFIDIPLSLVPLENGLIVRTKLIKIVIVLKYFIDMPNLIFYFCISDYFWIKVDRYIFKKSVRL